MDFPPDPVFESGVNEDDCRSVVLAPCNTLNHAQLSLLSKMFNFENLSWVKMRKLLCDGKEHVIAEGIFPDVLEVVIQEFQKVEVRYQITKDGETGKDCITGGIRHDYNFFPKGYIR